MVQNYYFFSWKPDYVSQRLTEIPSFRALHPQNRVVISSPFSICDWIFFSQYLWLDWWKHFTQPSMKWESVKPIIHASCGIERDNVLELIERKKLYRYLFFYYCFFGGKIYFIFLRWKRMFTLMEQPDPSHESQPLSIG